MKNKKNTKKSTFAKATVDEKRKEADKKKKMKDDCKNKNVGGHCEFC